MATCGGDDETIKGAIRNAYNNTTAAGILTCSDYDAQTALTATGNSTCAYNLSDVILFKITKTTGSTTTNSATPCTVTGTVASGGTCDDSCTAGMTCSGNLVCSGDSTDTSRTCIEPPCTVTGAVESGGTCDDSCTAGMTCSGDLVCSGDSTDTSRTCIEPPSESLLDNDWVIGGIVVALVLAVVIGLSVWFNRSNSGEQPSSSEVDPLVS